MFFVHVLTLPTKRLSHLCRLINSSKANTPGKRLKGKHERDAKEPAVKSDCGALKNVTGQSILAIMEEDQAVVIHAISLISMKLGQIEGPTTYLITSSAKVV